MQTKWPPDLQKKVGLRSCRPQWYDRLTTHPPPPGKLLKGRSKVNIMLYMNHVIHHIETPPGLTPPRLLAGGWEGKVLYVDSQGLTPPRLLPGGREGKVLYVESQHYVIYEPRDSSY